MSNYTLGSLFDGSGGFPLAGSLCGIEPVWASEIEPYPIAVTCSRFPNMKHLGDISKVKGGEVEPVDIVSFGSPCQDLSIAGLRKGLRHEANGDEETTRSGLFMEAVRIIKEMREATNGKYPRFALWENVPGAFSSNKGEDFRVVLEELIEIVEPTASMPSVPQNGWPYADCYRGDGWSIAYRVLDAQYWGVPQRRRRIYLVADFGGECAGQILFEREGLRGYFETGRTPWQTAAGDAEDGVGADDRTGGSVAYSFDRLASNSMKPKNPHSGCRRVEIAKTLDTTDPNPCKNQGGIAIVEPAYCLQGNMIGRADKNGPQGDGVNEDVSFTCNTTDRHAVAYSIGNGQLNQISMSETCNTLDCMHDKQAVLVEHERPAVRYIVRRLTPTECARLQGFPGKWGHLEPKSDFSDAEYSFWQEVRNTHAAINGKAEKEYSKDRMLTWYNKLHTDSSEYKMWGNGIALPTALYVMQGIADALKGEGKVYGLIGYSGIGSESGKFVAAEDAREHVLKECGLAVQESTYLSDEAMDALVEWYFSGEWIEVMADD
ncbi:MAG: DNA cytosine methyltransferase [Oscillospiraceae bacterium]|nr:DNA cytosine methyltransferase [Oscillospiraceae bacterium]